MSIPAGTPGEETTGICLQCGLPVASGHSLRSHPEEYCCYGCYLLHTLTGIKGEEARPTLFLARLGFAAFLAMNAQIFTWALYGEDLPFLVPVEPDLRQTINYVVFVLALPVYLLIGIPFVRNALREFRMLALGVDSLIAIGTTSAFVYSVYSTFTGSLSIYYDTATMVLVLVTFGRYLEATARLKAKGAIGQLATAMPATAHVICDGAEVDVPASAVPMGAHVKVLPGEQIPVDGRVVEGESTVDESLLTGEADPLLKQAGDSVKGGSISHDGYLRVEATGVADGMYLIQLHHLVDEILRTRSPSQELAERIARYFTPAVVVLAVGTALFWSVKLNLSAGLLAGLSVLLIACPCGLGIGATLAASVAYVRAAHHGVIAKSFSILERVGEIKTVFIDKTGTLTEGKPRLEALLLYPACLRTENEVLRIVASLESKSEHPTALAITGCAKGRHLELGTVYEFRNIPGLGVTGVVVDSEGNRVQVRVTREPEDAAGKNFGIQHVTTSSSASYVYLDSLFSGIVLVGDLIRSSASEAVSRFQSLQTEVTVLSGDQVGVTERVAREAGINRSRGGVTPIGKVSIVAEAQRNGGGVCMIGDGINDAAALAAADIGVTLGSSTGFAKSASDIIVVDGDLRKLPWIMQYGGIVRRAIRWNFVWVFLYNTIGIGFAVAGQIRPVFAALAMVLSSVLVIANSSRLAKIRVQ